MAYASHEDFKDAIRGKTDGADVVQISGAGGSAPAPTAQPTTPGVGVEGTAAPVPSSPPPGDSLGYGEGGLQSQLFDPLSQGLRTGQEALGGAIESFDQAAGPERTWATSGAQDALQAYYMGTGDEGEARNYVNAAYTGPQTLGFTPDQDLMTRSNALNTGSGLTGLIQSGNPGHTPGMARFDAQALWNDPGYQKQADTYESQIDQYFQDVAKEQARAAATAETRTEQEADIRDKSRDFVSGMYDTTLGDIDQTVAGRNASNQAVYDEFGALSAQGGLTPEQQKEYGLWTSVDDQQAEVQAAYDEILARYPDITVIEPGALTRDWKGHELTTFTVGDETFSIDDAFNGRIPEAAARELGLKTKEDQIRYGEQLRQRQRELDALFSPGQWRDRYAGRWPGYEARWGANDVTQTPLEHRELLGFTGEPGAYAAFDPLYHQEVLGQPTAQLPNPANYVQGPEELLSEGATHEATRENTATPEQRAQLERAETLMSELKSLSDAGMVFEAARIGADYEQFLEDQEAAIAARERLLGDASDAWKDEVQAARNAYVAAKEHEAWGTVANVLSAIPMTAGFGAIAHGANN